MYICKKCGGEIMQTEAIKNYYIVEKDGEIAEFVSDYDGLCAAMKWECTKCGRTTKSGTMRALKRMSYWED